jgi:hypothetical protein
MQVFICTVLLALSQLAARARPFIASSASIDHAASRQMDPRLRECSIDGFMGKVPFEKSGCHDARDGKRIDVP